MSAELSGSTVAKIENGRQALTLEYAQEIGDILGVSFLEVLGLDDVGVRVVPLLGEVQAGDWREAIAVTEATQAVPGHLRGENLFALKAKGDSMNKVVGDGGVVVINPDDKELVDQKVYVVLNGDGEATVKRFSANPLQLEPCSTNESHRPIRIGSEAFTVVGRVIYAGQEL